MPAASRPVRGRPRATTTGEISAAAFELFRDAGYDAVTMTDIAAAVGVSAPTLFRYFPTKGSILWDGYQDSLRTFKDYLEQTDHSIPMIEALFQAYERMLVRGWGDLTVMKARIELVARESGEVVEAWSHYEEWSRTVIAYVAQRRGADDFEAVVLGSAIWSALWAAVVQWARSTDAEPTATLERARAVISALS